MLSASEIIIELITYLGINEATLAKVCGYKREQVIYDVTSGKTKSISSKLANKIINAFPDINLTWLLTGKGEMQNNSNISIVQEPTAPYGKTIIEMFKAGEIYPYIVVEKKENEIALLNQEIGRLKAELDQKKKVSALLDDNAGVADAK